MAITHLNLNQTTSSIEVVSSTIIDKLYELAKTNLDETSTMSGNLQVTHAYADAVTYLLNKYPSLQINVTGGAYIRFADSTAASICAINWGDGIGLTTINAQAVTSLNTKFKSNTSITSFNELKSFINVKTLLNSEFYGDNKLTSIDLSNVTYINDSGFNGCTSLTDVGDTSGITVINGYAFNQCSKLVNIDTSNVTTINGDRAFSGCTSLKSVNLQNCTSIGANAFLNCTSLESLGDTSKVTYIGQYQTFDNTSNLKIDFNFPSLQTIAGHCNNSGFTNVVNCGTVTSMDGTFKGCRNLKTVVFPETCATLGGSILENCSSLIWVKVMYNGIASLIASSGLSNTNNCKIYVSDASVAAYKTATNWSIYASRIFSLTQFAIDFPNG